jgi:uroporphyrinogen decarboxylase
MSDISPRDRVRLALSHRAPDRTPVDFLAVPEIWAKLAESFGLDAAAPTDDLLYDPLWEAVLRRLEVDCRVVSYDQFCSPPESACASGGSCEWWKVQSRSTPARMWRWKTEDGLATDIFGRRFRVQSNRSGSYEENLPCLASVESLDEVKAHHWPDPDWWDFSGAPALVRDLNEGGERHIRYRMGSVFELAWQLRGMDNFMVDMALDSPIPRYMMERITEITVETTERFLAAAGDGVDMLYFYDDIAANSSLLISREMWASYIKPCHQRLIDVAHRHGKQVMYHSDGAMRPLIGELIDMGVDLLNPIQPGVEGMETEGLKRDFGDCLCFHGGLDIVGILPKGSPDEVRAEARRLMADLGKSGGYILASSHHIQADTALANILALYEPSLR